MDSHYLHHIGSDGIIIPKEQIRKSRKKKGECPDCGTKLFKIKIFGNKKLSLPGKVDDGKCLVCCPQVKVVGMSQTKKLSNRQTKNPYRHSAPTDRPYRASTTSIPSSTVIHRNRSAPTPSTSIKVPSLSQSELNPASEDDMLSDSNLGLTPNFDLENPRSVIKTLENNLSSVIIQEQALKALLNFQLSQTDKKEIVNSGGVEVVIAGLKYHEFSHDIQLYACKILRELCVLSDSLTVILESGGIKAIVNTMQSFPEDDEIEESCLSILSLVFEKNHRVVMKTLEDNLSSVLVQKHALKALLKFQLSEADKLEIVSSGGIEVVVAGMEHQESSQAIQLDACKVLCKLSALSDSPTVISESGGIKAVVNAMNRFPEYVEIQELSLSILSSVGLLEVVLKSGGIQSLISAMNVHHGSVQVQTSGCAILSSAKLLGDDIKENIGEIGGINAAAFALLMNPGDKSIVLKALSAIYDLCFNHDRNMDRLNGVEVEGIDSIISIMHHHRNDSDIQEAGAQALFIFGGNNKNRYILKQKGGLDVLILSLIVHTEHIGVQECASSALYGLSMGDECCNTIIELGGIRAAIEVLQKHTGNSKIVENLFSLLSNLASKDQISKVNIVKAEVLDDIVLVMMLHSDNMIVQSKACALLKDLACESNVGPIMASDVSGCMVCASATFPECQQDTDYVLSVIQ